jgi:hypothetical protein
MASQYTKGALTVGGFKVGRFKVLPAGSDGQVLTVDSSQDIGLKYVTLATGGVTNGDAHDHYGGDGAQIDFTNLGNKPTLGDSAAKNVGTGANDVAAGNRGVTNGDSHDHNGGDGAQIAYASLSGTPILPLDVSSCRRTGSTREHWYTMPTTGTALGASGALASGRMYAIPFYCPKTIILDTIAINVTTTASGAACRLGIYNCTNNNEPGTLLIDAGVTVNTTTGVKTVACVQSLTGGNTYWLAMLSNNATHAVRAAPVAAVLNVLGFDNTLGTAGINYYYAAQTYGALPGTFPTVTNGTGATPLVFVRLSA